MVRPRRPIRVHGRCCAGRAVTGTVHGPPAGGPRARDSDISAQGPRPGPRYDPGHGAVGSESLREPEPRARTGRAASRDGAARAGRGNEGVGLSAPPSPHTLSCLHCKYCALSSPRCRPPSLAPPRPARPLSLSSPLPAPCPSVPSPSSSPPSLSPSALRAPSPFCSSPPPPPAAASPRRRGRGRER